MVEKGETMEMQPEGMRRIISSSPSRVYLARLGAGRWMGWIRWPAGGLSPLPAFHYLCPGKPGSRIHTHRSEALGFPPHGFSDLTRKWRKCSKLPSEMPARRMSSPSVGCPVIGTAQHRRDPRLIR